MTTVGWVQGWGGEWYTCGTKQRGAGRMLADTAAHPKCEAKTMITLSSKYAALGRVQWKMVSVPGKA